MHLTLSLRIIPEMSQLPAAAFSSVLPISRSHPRSFPPSFPRSLPRTFCRPHCRPYSKPVSHPQIYSKTATPTTPSQSLNDPTLLASSSFINNTFTPLSTPHFPIINPSTGSPIHHIHEPTEHHLTQALTSAQQAQKLWERTKSDARIGFLNQWQQQIQAHKQDLTRLIVLENGKSFSDASAEVDYALSFLSWNAQQLLHTHSTSCEWLDQQHLALKSTHPIGVCLLITPWNFPVAMIIRKAAAAIAAGCAVIVKPSEKTPLTALALAELSKRAGGIGGVLNVLVTERAQWCVDIIMEGVRMVSFTGSTKVGKMIGEKAMKGVKKVSLELGGVAPCVVFADADLEQCVEAILKNKMRGGGQTCIAISRIYVEEKVYEEFVQMLANRWGKVAVGDGMEEGSEIGPLIDENAVQKVEWIVKDAVDKGGKVRCGGERIGGAFFEPTVVSEARDDMLICEEEVFGPVLGVLRFESEEEVWERANRGESGLVGYVFTKDGGRMMRAGREMKFGMVGVNDVGVSSAKTAFGGIKESGVGREGGVGSLEPFLETKYTVMRGMG